MSFGLIQTGLDAPNIELSATIDNWPSSTRAEVAAVFSALIISPVNSDIIINTDSETLIRHFNLQPLVPSSRSILKEQDKYLWIAIRETIIRNGLSVRFNKVDAHSGNYFNDKVDALSKAARYSSKVLSLKVSNFITLQVAPVWKNIRISTHLRHFIADISRNDGFEKWFNLHRNSKYRRLQIDWHSTFSALDNDEDSSSTSFQASSVKRSKIKYLIEELPTVEHIKKRRPDLYDNWLCPRCNSVQESFNHVWLCSNISTLMARIILETQTDLHHLVSEVVTSSLPSRVYLIPPIILENHTMWSLSFSSQEFTFIDLIKGFIPLELFTAVFSLVNNTDTARGILNIFRDNLYVRIRDLVWSPRCELIITKEKTLNITSRQKKRKNTSSKKYITNPPLLISDPSLENSNLGLIDFIRNGRDWLDFMLLVNHIISICFILIY
jgi:ribonuclease HI